MVIAQALDNAMVQGVEIGKGADEDQEILGWRISSTGFISNQGAAGSIAVGQAVELQCYRQLKSAAPKATR